jgi:dihydrofolate reductase
MINIIVAHTKNRGIGIGNRLPWTLPSDMIRFKQKTIGKGNNSVIMGRKTWDSIPENSRPLESRHNIVISNTLKQSDKYTLCTSIEEALRVSYKRQYDETWIIGGERIYEQALNTNIIDKIYVTNIYNDTVCDTFFPPLSSYYTIDNSSVTGWLNDSGTWYRYETYNGRHYFSP